MKQLYLTIIIFIFTACGSLNEDTLVIYEDAEHALNPKWKTVKGDGTPSRIKANNGSNFCLNLPVHWEQDSKGKWYNPYEYHLDLSDYTNSVLELDVGGTGMDIPHYIVGVVIESNFGKRTLYWDSWYNHNDFKPNITKLKDGSATLVYPSPVELVRGYDYESTTKWSHFKVDINEYLQDLEPDNYLIYVKTFIATGGNLDNIGLSN